MKIRQGFVSNSSSSSFIINCQDVDEKRLKKIYNHINEYNGEITEQEKENRPYRGHDQEWAIRPHAENPKLLFCSTSMNNFPLEWWVQKQGIDRSNLAYTEYGYDFYISDHIINLFTPVEELIAFLEISKEVATGCSFYIVIDKESKLTVTDLKDHLALEKKRFEHTPTQYFKNDGKYLQWEITNPFSDKRIFFCTTNIENKFDLSSWCISKGVSSSNIIYFRYFIDKQITNTLDEVLNLYQKRLSIYSGFEDKDLSW